MQRGESATFSKEAHGLVKKVEHFALPLTGMEEKKCKIRFSQHVTKHFFPTACNTSQIFSPSSLLYSTLAPMKTSPPPMSQSSINRKKRKREEAHHIHHRIRDSTGVIVNTITERQHRKRRYCFVGTSQNLEKPYFRLTTFPRPENVRPLGVLEQALQHVKQSYAANQNFEWANEQMKSIRQDITVQGIRNPFALSVYETHARIALENGKLNEFHGCQCMVRSFTCGRGISVDNDADEDVPERGLPEEDSFSSSSSDSALSPELEESADMMDIDSSNVNLNRIDGNGGSGAWATDGYCLLQSKKTADEFAAYRLLFAVVARNWADVNESLRCSWKHNDNNNASSSSALNHARKTALAVIHNDYVTFFRLYKNAPNMSAYLMDFLVQRVRQAAYQRIVVAYLPGVGLDFVKKALHFKTIEETKDFLVRRGGEIAHGMKDGELVLDCRAMRRR